MTATSTRAPSHYRPRAILYPFLLLVLCLAAVYSLGLFNRQAQVEPWVFIVSMAILTGMLMLCGCVVQQTYIWPHAGGPDSFLRLHLGTHHYPPGRRYEQVMYGLPPVTVLAFVAWNSGWATVAGALLLAAAAAATYATSLAVTGFWYQGRG